MFLWRSVMSSAIALIVDGYARVKDRQSFEELRINRRRLAGDLKAWVGFDCRLSIAQIEQDIAAIEAGLETLSGPVGGQAKESTLWRRARKEGKCCDRS